VSRSAEILSKCCRLSLTCFKSLQHRKHVACNLFNFAFYSFGCTTHFLRKLFSDLETDLLVWSIRIEWYLIVSCSELATLFKAWETAGSPLKCMLTCNMLCTRLLWM
jgi:hypothetical protein